MTHKVRSAAGHFNPVLSLVRHIFLYISHSSPSSVFNLVSPVNLHVADSLLESISIQQTRDVDTRALHSVVLAVSFIFFLFASALTVCDAHPITMICVSHIDRVLR